MERIFSKWHWKNWIGLERKKKERKKGKWNKPDIERQTLRDLTYVWNLKYWSSWKQSEGWWLLEGTLVPRGRQCHLNQGKCCGDSEYCMITIDNTVLCLLSKRGGNHSAPFHTHLRANFVRKWTQLLAWLFHNVLRSSWRVWKIG